MAVKVAHTDINNYTSRAYITTVTLMGRSTRGHSVPPAPRTSAAVTMSCEGQGCARCRGQGQSCRVMTLPSRACVRASDARVRVSARLLRPWDPRERSCLENNIICQECFLCWGSLGVEIQLVSFLICRRIQGILEQQTQNRLSICIGIEVTLLNLENKFKNTNLQRFFRFVFLYTPLKTHRFLNFFIKLISWKKIPL